MATRTEYQPREQWDSLSPYELAVLTFTSPDMTRQTSA